MEILGGFRLGDEISFELKVSAILAQDYDHVIVKGVVPASSCDIFGLDAYATHEQVYPLLPEGSVANDADSYSYLLVENLQGQKRVVGLPWINESTIKIHRKQTAVFTVLDIKQEDVVKIRDVIARYGYNCTFSIG